MVYMYHSFLIHSSADGHLGCFHVLAMINSAAMNIGVHVSLSDLVSLVCMPRSGISGSYGSSISSSIIYPSTLPITAHCFPESHHVYTSSRKPTSPNSVSLNKTNIQVVNNNQPKNGDCCSGVTLSPQAYYFYPQWAHNELERSHLASGKLTENQWHLASRAPVKVTSDTEPSLIDSIALRLVCVCVLSRSVVSDSLWHHGLQSTRLLCPLDFPDKNTGVCCNFLLQGIFLTQRSELSLLHLLNWEADSFTTESPGKHLMSSM